MLTRRPTEWSQNIKILLENDTDLIEGILNKITDDPFEAIINSNIIILCGPVSSYPSMLKNIKHALLKYKDNNIMLGAIFGQCGFHWICKNMFDPTE